MIPVTQLQTLYGNLSQNTSTENLALGLQLMNIEHRYLLQKYFSNEGSFTSSTVGPLTLATTGALSSGATSATLTVAWAYHSTTAYVTFSNSDVRVVNFTRSSTAITWGNPLSAAATTVLSISGLQFYPAPPNYSKLKTVTITNGNLTWTPTQVLTREDWDKLNTFPYYASIPNNYYIYPGGDHGVQIGIWPIPSSTGLSINFNYKFRVPDLSLTDYSTGTVAVTSGATAITGSGTVFTPTTNLQNETRWIQISQTKGDNLWYQVSSVDSSTGITLYQPYQGITVTGGSYTLGQMPLLMEDFHDMLVWKALTYYFSSTVDNKTKWAEYKGLYDEKLKMLEDYAGSKTTNVNLGRRPNMSNPNLYPQTLS